MEELNVLYEDIDGVTARADIQGYVSQIELFGDEPIKNFEYIKKCIRFMLDKAKKENASSEEIGFIERVYRYVSVNMFEMLKEYRDCFLEWDNLTSFEAKKKYIEGYTRNPVISSNNEEIPSYMKYIISALKYALTLFEREYQRVKHEGGVLILPFETVNHDNDIISYDGMEDPLQRASSALKYMEIYALNREKGRDDFLTACQMVGDTQIVDYNEIYSKKNLMPDVGEGLKFLLESGKIDLIIVCSHFTGTREAIAKRKLFEEELPFVLFLDESLLKFHIEPAQMGKRRERSSKNLLIDRINAKIKESLEIMKKIQIGNFEGIIIEEIHVKIMDALMKNEKFMEKAKEFGVDPEKIKAMLVDDSMPNLETLLGKIAILFRKRKENESSVNEEFFILEAWSIEDITATFDAILQNSSCNEKQNGFVKKLV